MVMVMVPLPQGATRPNPRPAAPAEGALTPVDARYHVAPAPDTAVAAYPEVTPVFHTERIRLSFCVFTTTFWEMDATDEKAVRHSPTEVGMRGWDAESTWAPKVTPRCTQWGLAPVVQVPVVFVDPHDGHTKRPPGGPRSLGPGAGGFGGPPRRSHLIDAASDLDAAGGGEVVVG